MDEDTRLKLIGLQALAVDHNQRLADIKRAACTLFGEPDDDPTGWVSDFVYGEARLDDTWEVLEKRRKSISPTP